MRELLHALLPKKLSSAAMYKLARIKTGWVKNIFIKLFMLATKANLADAKRKEIEDYDSLLDFFTRELTESARPINQGKHSISSPVDGRVAHCGSILEDQIFQIKGNTYSLTQLVSEDFSAHYRNGIATTLYLAPHNYHRIHCPVDAKLINAKYIPGELNSVSIKLLDKISGLFAKNERIVLEFESQTESAFRFILVLVGAVNVGSIETVFHGQVTPNKNPEPSSLPASDKLVKKGEEIGRFNLGSTVILIAPKDSLDFILDEYQAVRVGQNIGQIHPEKTKESANITDSLTI